jgi:Peptidase family S41
MPTALIKHRANPMSAFRASLCLTALVFAGCAATTRTIAASETTCTAPRLSASAPLPPARFPDGPTIPAEGIRSDLDGWLTGMAKLNPDLSIRTDTPAMEREAAAIRASIAGPLSRREAWLLFSRINPHLRDGHSGILMPDAAAVLQQYLTTGGRIVPLELRFDPSGTARVFAPSDRASPFRQGDRLLAINGKPIGEIVDYLLARSPGDTPAFRRAWLARRFATLYWIALGDTRDYDISYEDQGGCRHDVRVPGATVAPVLAQAQPSPSDLYQQRILDNDVGYLRVASFAGENREAFATFATKAFADLKAANIRSLIIDVRDNSGGDDPLWQQSLMNNITTTPYAQLSRFVIRVTERNADPGDVIGSVQRSEYTRRFTPDADNPNRFNGPVFVLGGPFSYSAAIQFMVAGQDFHIAKIAGEETGAFSCQTGQVNTLAMPLTGLRAFTPIIAYTRPSGRGCARGLVPDITVPMDEVYPDRTLDALVKAIKAERAD